MGSDGGKTAGHWKIPWTHPSRGAWSSPQAGRAQGSAPGPRHLAVPPHPIGHRLSGLHWELGSATGRLCFLWNGSSPGREEGLGPRVTARQPCQIRGARQGHPVLPRGASWIAGFEQALAGARDRGQAPGTGPCRGSLTTALDPSPALARSAGRCHGFAIRTSLRS